MPNQTSFMVSCPDLFYGLMPRPLLWSHAQPDLFYSLMPSQTSFIVSCVCVLEVQCYDCMCKFSLCSNCRTIYSMTSYIQVHRMCVMYNVMKHSLPAMYCNKRRSPSSDEHSLPSKGSTSSWAFY